jgi:hypothetical protein
MKAYQDSTHKLNGPKYQTGKPCIEKCGRIAGTYWSPYWCQPCNVKRMDRISASLKRIGIEIATKREANG